MLCMTETWQYLCWLLVDVDDDMFRNILNSILKFIIVLTEVAAESTVMQ